MARNIPAYPLLFDMPFAHNGDKQNIPTSTTSAGKASLDSGFPIECSRPLEDDGIPPSRTDMNGVLNLISQWAFYAQSGGLAKYDSSLNYTVPALISHGNVIYTCIKNNGPDTTNGAKVPGATGSETFWQAGLGNISTNVFGTNANSYTKTGTYWIDDAQATTNFPEPGKGGFLSVMEHGKYYFQHFVCREGYVSAGLKQGSNSEARNTNYVTHVYSRMCVNGSWQSWTRIVNESELFNGAYTQIFMSTGTPQDSQGKNGDVWFQYK